MHMTGGETEDIKTLEYDAIQAKLSFNGSRIYWKVFYGPTKAYILKSNTITGSSVVLT